MLLRLLSVLTCVPGKQKRQQKEEEFCAKLFFHFVVENWCMEQPTRKKQKICPMASSSSAWKKNRSFQLPAHPFGVKPIGNQYLDGLDQYAANQRSASLGQFSVLDDELIIFLLR